MTDHAAPRVHCPPASGFLYWPPQFQAYGYRIVDQLFHSRVVKRGNSSQPLSYGKELSLTYRGVDGETRDIDGFMEHNVVAGLLVMRHGEVVLERYGLGLRDKDRWSTMSTIKSVTSMLVGAAIRDGVLGGLDDPVEAYLPTFEGTAYAGVTIGQLMTMSSGMAWSEVYSDPRSHVNQYSHHLAAGKPNGVIDLLHGLDRAHPAGRRWLYNTGDTYLLGRTLTAALKRPLAEYLSEKIWRPAGMEHDAFYTLDAENGHEIAGSRAGMTLRDLGRFAQFVMNDGQIGGESILPDGWVDAAFTPSFTFDEADRDFGAIRSLRLKGYGYSWWLGEDGSAQALGFAGQRLFIDRTNDLSIITLSAFPQPPHVPAPQPDRERELYQFTEAVRNTPG